MSLASEWVAVDLALLGQAADARCVEGDYVGAAAIAKTILLRLPRHLPTYQRLLQIASVSYTHLTLPTSDLV